MMNDVINRHCLCSYRVYSLRKTKEWIFFQVVIIKHTFVGFWVFKSHKRHSINFIVVQHEVHIYKYFLSVFVAFNSEQRFLVPAKLKPVNVKKAETTINPERQALHRKHPLKNRYIGSGDICDDEPPLDNCLENNDMPVTKYFWDSRQGLCMMFNYKKCPGSNVFDSITDCISTCLKPTIISKLSVFETCHNISDLAFCHTTLGSVTSHVGMIFILFSSKGFFISKLDLIRSISSSLIANLW